MTYDERTRIMAWIGVGLSVLSLVLMVLNGITEPTPDNNQTTPDNNQTTPTTTPSESDTP